jgi:hypothetical protein
MWRQEAQALAELGVELEPFEVMMLHGALITAFFPKGPPRGGAQ